MRLFWLIHKATVEGESDALWELILRFSPMITGKSKHPTLGKIDEDLKSEMQLILARRVRNNFSINLQPPR